MLVECTQFLTTGTFLFLRITNTINTVDGRKLYRPSVINAYCGPALTSIPVWWEQWKLFLFHTYVEVVCDSQTASQPRPVCTLFQKIQRSKYPAITAEEQALSVPLQILCLAVLDAIFLHIANSVAPVQWEELRSHLCDVMVHGKEQGVCNIIGKAYSDMDVVFVQVRDMASLENVSYSPVLKAPGRWHCAGGGCYPLSNRHAARSAQLSFCTPPTQAAGRQKRPKLIGVCGSQDVRAVHLDRRHRACAGAPLRDLPLPWRLVRHEHPGPERSVVALGLFSWGQQRPVLTACYECAERGGQGRISQPQLAGGCGRQYPFRGQGLLSQVRLLPSSHVRHLLPPPLHEPSQCCSTTYRLV